MEKVVKILAVHRRTFDQVFNDILNLFGQENSDKIAIFSKINILEQKIQVLIDLHRQMVDFSLDDGNTLNKEISTADEYSDSETKKKLKLPKIEFRKFGDEIKEWFEKLPRKF
ncbi:uncharacterized protein [Leptinotarsa decemlineata]|uniref:uncharacterized protein n=1 Tax=Leptinotarsa decemlineata TaxID=7539 RepID=UPI003D309574